MREQRAEVVKCENCNGTGYKGKNVCPDCNSKGVRVIVRYYDVPESHVHIVVKKIN